MPLQAARIIATPAGAHAVRLEIGRHDVRAGAERRVALLRGAVLVQDGAHGHVGAGADPVVGADLLLDVCDGLFGVGLVELG